MKTVLNFNEVQNKEDGKDYINIFSGGRTKLGKLLSNFAHTPFTHNDKLFESVEGYWYYKVSGGDKKFQFLYGLEAKQRGKEIKGRHPEPTKEELKSVYLSKLKHNSELKKQLIESDLPFSHHYEYSGKKVSADKYLWTVELWEEIRNELKEQKPMDKYQKLFGPEWARVFKFFLESDEFKQIGKTLKQLQTSGTKVYPLFDDVFKAFHECPYKELTAVIITNNAYTKESDGLAFSSSEKTPILTKIFEAFEQDISRGLYLKRETDLTYLANQGVLLLNLDLTIDSEKKIDHIKLWKPFIDYLMRWLAEYNSGIIYLLIGNKAKKYVDNINVLSNDFYLTEHPMMAVLEDRPWRDKNIFSDTNRVSKFINNKEIQWTFQN